MRPLVKRHKPCVHTWSENSTLRLGTVTVDGLGEITVTKDEPPERRNIVELRRLLDECGVEHYDGTESTLWLKDEHGYRASADELSSGRLSVHIWCDTPEQAIAATLGSEREKELVRAMEDVLRHSTDTVWVGEAETLVDRMVSLGVYKHDVYEGARPWEVDE